MYPKDNKENVINKSTPVSNVLTGKKPLNFDNDDSPKSFWEETKPPVPNLKSALSGSGEHDGFDDDYKDEFDRSKSKHDDSPTSEVNNVSNADPTNFASPKVDESNEDDEEVIDIDNEEELAARGLRKI